MLIDTELSEKIRNINIDDKFKEALFDAYKEFSKQIMMELTLFSYDPSEFGFADLELVSREYAVQKYFEPRIETYVRQHLVTNFFAKVLEDRGYDVYTTTYNIPDDQYVDGEVFCSNKEYEDNAVFEFMIRHKDELIGCRLTDMHSWKANKVFEAGMITKIIVIDWLNIDGVSEEEKLRRTYGITGNIDIMGIREFVSQWLGSAESFVYELFVRKTIQEYQETIGISSLPKLTGPVLFEHRLDEERIILKNSIRDIQLFSKIEKEDSSLPLDQRRNTHFGYNIIDPDNFRTEQGHSKNIEERSKQLLSDSGVLETYETRKLYKALVGKADFAKSFLTSEYLYSQYNENDLFDYTAIVSGYLKSIEQLLSTIIFRFADTPVQPNIPNVLYRIKSNGKKKSDGTFPVSSRKERGVYKIDLLNSEAEYVDTTLGSLNHFIKDYKRHILAVSKKYWETIVDCLECYRIECRNDSFHTHNNYDWDKVVKIRHNTIILYIILLGGILLDSDDETVRNRLDIVDDDRLERVYYWLRANQMYTFRIKFEGEYFLATRHAEESFPIFDNNGLLQNDFKIVVRCIKENSDNKENRWFTITRDSIPEEIWYTTYVNSYPIDYDL